jgi:hypothetical protein
MQIVIYNRIVIMLKIGIVFVKRKIILFKTIKKLINLQNNNNSIRLLKLVSIKI